MDDIGEKMELKIFAYKPKIVGNYLPCILGLLGIAVVLYPLFYPIDGIRINRLVLHVPFPILNIVLVVAGSASLWYVKQTVVKRVALRKYGGAITLDDQDISFSTIRGRNVGRRTKPYASIDHILRTGEEPRQTGQGRGPCLLVQFADGSTELFRESCFSSSAAFITFSKQLKQRVAEARDGVV